MSVQDIFLVRWWYDRVGAHPRIVKRILLWTLIATVLGMALGAWQVLRQPPLHQVKITLAVYPPHFRWSADGRIQTLNRPRGDARQMAMVMSKGPEVLDRVIATLGDRLPEELRDRKRLSQHLSVRGGAGVYVYLTVNGTDLELTREIAEAWARATEDIVERAFYRYDADIPLLEQQVDTLGKQLEQAEQEIEAFRVRTGLGLVDESRTAIIVSDAKGLRPGLAGFEARTLELGTVNGQLAAYRHAQTLLRDLANQVQQAKTEGRPVQDVPLELITSLEPVVARGQLRYEDLRNMGNDYDHIIAALQAEADALQPGIDVLEQESTALRQGLSSDITQLRRLLRQRDSVEGLYKALLAKQNELRAEAAVSSNYVDVVDIRTPGPTRGFRLLLSLLAGAILGGFLGFTLATTWYAMRRSAG